ncbi:MAG: hypothetical protein OXB97_08185 [Rhodospirillales bacterium]|nr:hypothetical protein [Rhodospirillales bacterium]
MTLATLAMLFAITAAPAPEPVTVWLGVDCSSGAEPFMVGLPDDVAIGECAY